MMITRSVFRFVFDGQKFSKVTKTLIKNIMLLRLFNPKNVPFKDAEFAEKIFVCSVFVCFSSYYFLVGIL